MSIVGSERIAELESKIADKVGPQRFKIWFKHATQFQFTDGFLRVGVPNMFIGGWIENHFSGVISEAAREATEKDWQLIFTIDPSLSKNLRKSQLDSQVTFMTSNPERLAREHRRNGTVPEPNKLRGQFSDFVVGESNRLAHTCAMSVLDHPGRQYNPLFIHGGCGLGKTHLLQAVFNAMRDRDPKIQCLYLTGEEFTNQFVYSIKTGNRDAFRHRFRNTDLLLIDDIHFLANKTATQEEFLHTFNAIDAFEKQIIMASDSHPKLIGNLSASLVNRFVSGMVVKIDPPSYEHRLEILRRRCVQMKKEIHGLVLEYVASMITTNVRELEGALIKIVAFSTVTHQPITLALAQQALADHLNKTTRIVKLSDIESVCAIYFGLSPGDLHTSRKTRTIALARGIAMWLARKHTTMSFPEIGQLMGNKNHSTVLLACAKMNEILRVDGEVRWNTPTSEQQKRLRPLIEEIELQLGLAGRGRVTTQTPEPERHERLDQVVGVATMIPVVPVHRFPEAATPI